MIDYQQFEVDRGEDGLGVANVVLTTKCNAQCDGCAYWRIEPEHLPIETFERFVDHVESEDPRGVLLTGGDPVLHPEIDRVLEILDERGLSVVLNTQAWSLHRLTDEQLAQIDSYVISIDSDRAEVYHELRKGPLQVVEESIERIQSVSTDAHLTANILIQKRNAGHIAATVRYARSELGMDSASLLVPSVEPQGFGWEYEGEDEPAFTPLDLEEISQLESQFHDLLSEEGTRSFISQPANALSDYLEYFKLMGGHDGELSKRACFVPKETITLTPHGDFKPCFYLPDRFQWDDHTENPVELDARREFVGEYEDEQPRTCEHCMQFACNERLRPVVKWASS